MARPIAAKEDVGSTIERVIALVAIGTGVLVAPLAASATHGYTSSSAPMGEAASAIPPACFAMVVRRTDTVRAGGYLWAIGDASFPYARRPFGIPAACAGPGRCSR